MTTLPEDLRKILNCVNVIALVAIGAYIWTDYNEEHQTPPNHNSSYLQSADTHAGTQRLIYGSVVRLTSGDSVTVRDETHTYHGIRLEGIDAPESQQAFARKSLEALTSMVQGEHVLVKVLGKAKGGRILGHMYIGRHWVNKQMIQRGWAWHCKRDSSDPILAQAEVFARKFKKGLWSDDPILAQYEVFLRKFNKGLLSDDAILTQAEVFAREFKKGLWSDPLPVAPWDFQKRESLYKPSDPNTRRNEIIKFLNDLETVPKNQVLPSIEKIPGDKGRHRHENRPQVT